MYYNYIITFTYIGLAYFLALGSIAGYGDIKEDVLEVRIFEEKSRHGCDPLVTFLVDDDWGAAHYQQVLSF